MIGHQALRADTHRAAFERLLDDPLESLEVRIFQEQTHSAHATIQNVENHPTGSNSGSAWHPGMLPGIAQFVNN